MRSRAGFTLALAAGLAVASTGGWLGCQFTPAGGGGGDDDGGGDDGGGDDSDAAAGDAAGPTDAAVGIDAIAVTVDAAVSVDARPPCPAAYTIAQGGSRYVRRSGADTIAGARGDCADDLAGRTMLATFENAADLDAVIDQTGAPGSERLWVGARCTSTSFGCAGPKSWTWDTGADLAPTLWVQGEPDNPFTDHSAAALKTGPSWKLMSTGTVPVETHPYVCECVE